MLPFWVAAGSLALLAYTYVGYPVVIALCARLWPMRGVVRDAAYTPMVSALIPAHDAAAFVGAKLDSLLAQDYPRGKLEILVLSDGSRDDTDAILARYAAADARVRPLRREERRGKPSALNLMRGEARGEVLLMTDVRQPLDPGALRTLVAPLADAGVGCVSGNLLLEGEGGAGVYWRYEKWIRERYPVHAGATS